MVSDCVRKIGSETAWAIGLAIVVAGTGCAGIPKLETVYDEDGVEVQLRTNKADPEGLFQHPAELAVAALAELLGPLQVENPSRRKKNEPLPAIHPDILKQVSEGVSLALGEANSRQTVAVTAVFRERKLVVLHRNYLTSLNLYRVDDRLYADFSRVQWEIPRNWRKDKIPHPTPGDPGMKIRLIGDSGEVDVEGGNVAILRWPAATIGEAGLSDLPAAGLSDSPAAEESGEPAAGLGD